MSEKTPALMLTEQLEATLYQFIQLYDRWSAERDIFAERGRELEKALQGLLQGIEAFKQSGNTFDENLAASLDALSQTLSTAVHDSLVKTLLPTLTQEVKDLTQQLAAATQFATEKFQQYDAEMYWFGRWWFIVIALVIGAVGAFLIDRLYLQPVAQATLSPQDITRLKEGVFIETVWPHLSKKEQAHLDVLYQKAIAPPAPPSQTIQEYAQ